MELVVDRLTKQYKNKIAVDRISFDFRKGVYGLLGANGAGKTTFMRMLCGILQPTGGNVVFDGIDVATEEYRSVLGSLPQDFGYYPELSISDYMMYIASIKGIRPMAARKRTKQLLGQVGMAKYEKRKMKTLSGGMARRIGIAQAMLNNPKILVLDEPTAGLDPNERIRFRNLISELSEDRLVLLSTHIVSDVEFIANQIMLMKNGELFYEGTTEELISSMDESVWHCTVPKNKANDFMARYLVGNVKTAPKGAELRILSKEPPMEGAVREEATLEDAFLLYFGEKAGDIDDTEI